MQINERYESPLSELIKKYYNQLTALLLQIPRKNRLEKEIDGTGGKVSISDVIAYQIGWGNLLISWYEAGLQGKMPQMPGEGFTKWDYVGLAQHFYQKYHYDGFAKQEKEFYKVAQQIINIAEKECKLSRLDKEGIWSWCTLASNKQWPLSKWIKVNTVAPYKRAIILIKKFILQSTTKSFG